MDNRNPFASQSAKPAPSAVNPFARALAETEKGAYGQDKSASNSNTNLFSDALARTGGNLPDNFNQQDLVAQQQEMIKQQEQAALRKKLHDQVNPVDQRDIFNAREKRTKQELEEIRRELQMLVQEIKTFSKEVDIAVSGRIVNQQGEEGKGLKSFFRNLRAFIMLLRQKVRSARTWATQMQAKKSKKRKIKGGLQFEGGNTQETKSIFDMMHHERSNAYSGG